jgi:predicted Zn-dependent protease
MTRRPCHSDPGSRRLDRRTFLLEAGQAGALALLAAALPGGSAFGRQSTTGAAGLPFSAPPGLADRLAEVVAALERKFPYAFGLYTRDESFTIECDAGGTRIGTIGPREGLVLGIWDGSALREEATSLVDDRGLMRLRDRLLEVPAPMPGSGGAPEPGSPLERSFREVGARAFTPGGLAASVEALRDGRDRLLRAGPKLTVARVDHYQGLTERLFVNRTRRLHQLLSRGGAGGFVMAPGSGGRPGALFLRRRGIGGEELCALGDADRELLVDRATRLAGAAPPDPGETTLVTEPNVSGVVAHESFGHGVEVDLFMKSRARAADYLGKAVAAPMVRLLDDPTQAGAPGFYHFDDEGAAAAPTVIIEDGVFRAGLTDLVSSRATGLPRTANGRREAWDRKCYARMSNTFFAPGVDRREELIRGVEKGLLVGHFTAGIEDPKGWGMQIVAQYGEEIVRGRLTGRVVSPVTLSGFVPDVLASIDGIADDFELVPGTCGKGYKE